MRYLRFFPIFLLLAEVGLTDIGWAQEPPVHPYVGASLNFVGVYKPGWGVGIALGAKAKSFYAGFEYGAYGINGIWPKTNTVSRSANYVDPPDSAEAFVGIHGGVVIKQRTLLGAVVLYSYQTGLRRFNVGPDLRYQSSKALMFVLAYTIRRGISAGVNFILG